MKVATRRLLEEQTAVLVVLESGKKDDAMWHVPHRQVSLRTHKYPTHTLVLLGYCAPAS